MWLRILIYVRIRVIISCRDRSQLYLWLRGTFHQLTGLCSAIFLIALALKSPRFVLLCCGLVIACIWVFDNSFSLSIF
jgi:hypothetical protein